MREETMMIYRAYKKIRSFFLNTVGEGESEETRSLRAEIERLQQELDASQRIVEGFHHLEQEKEFHRRRFMRLANLLEGETREKKAAQEELQAMENVKQELERKVDALEKEIAEESFGGSYSDSSATPTAFEAALAHANEALQNFSSALVLACPQIDFPGGFAGSNVFARKLHWKLALRCVLSNIFFTNFELEGFGVEHHTESLDAKEFRERCFEEYKLFLHGNEEELVQQLSEFSQEKARHICSVFKDVHVFWNSQGELKQELLQKFHKVVISVWRLHKLAFSFYPAARILRVCEGMKMNDEYMESALSADDVDEDECTYDEDKVCFAIFPGFTIRKSVFKCQVYPALIRV